MTLKYVKNESTRVRIQCAKDGYPFVLLVSKDGSNPSLAIKTLVKEHNHQFQRVLPNQACNARFLANHFKHKILKNPKYRVKDLKNDANDDELRVKPSYSKCKRTRKLVI